MNQHNFESIIQRATIDIQTQGYQIQNETSLYAIEFWKIPVKGVYCLIGFDLFQSEFLPNRFKTILIRRRLDNFELDDSQYKPLYLDLRNLMLGLHKKNIFQPNQHAWEFTDETSLLEQIAHAQSLIVEYGIKWLEDPNANIDWIKKSGDQFK